MKFVSFQFTDVTGAVKSVDMPVQQLAGALDDGVWFDGSSVEGFARIQESDMRLVLDPDTYAVLPWSPESCAGRACSAISITPDGDAFPRRPARHAASACWQRSRSAAGRTTSARSRSSSSSGATGSEHPPGAA